MSDGPTGPTAVPTPVPPEPGGGAPGPTVAGSDDTAEGGVDLDRWCTVARDTLRMEGVVGGHLDLLFVDPDEMADLNREHLGHTGPTDVLSFPLDGPEAVGAGAVGAGDPPSHLGDVVVCPQVATAQAPGHTGDVDTELTLLVVHGVLHVLGHDHAEPDETLVMQARERAHLERLGLRHPVAT